jgi:hypothetical protein
MALRLATGDLVVFLDDDDSFRPDFLENLAVAGAGARADEICYTNFELVNDGIALGDSPVAIQSVDIAGLDPDSVQVKNFIPNNCQVFPRQLLAGIEFDPSIAYEDWDFLLSACRRGSLRHLPVLGPRIHKSGGADIERRGQKNEAGLLECYLRIYAKHPPRDDRIAERRRQLFASLGLELDSLLDNRPRFD